MGLGYTENLEFLQLKLVKWVEKKNVLVPKPVNYCQGSMMECKYGYVLDGQLVCAYCER